MVAKTIDQIIPRRLQDASVGKLEIVPKKESIFITGPAGTGKSYMAAALVKDSIGTKAREWLEANMENDYLEREARGFHQGERFRYSSWRWITVPELLLSLRASFKDGAQFTEEEVIGEYSNVSLLILDDLGAEKSSEFTIQSLYLIIDRRYSEIRPTIITSNLSLGQISEKVGDRIASRIAGMCRVVELKGRDRRLSGGGK
jgi:DNA replication protein DnaC